MCNPGGASGGLPCFSVAEAVLLGDCVPGSGGKSSSEMRRAPAPAGWLFATERRSPLVSTVSVPIGAHLLQHSGRNIYSTCLSASLAADRGMSSASPVGRRGTHSMTGRTIEFAPLRPRCKRISAQAAQVLQVPQLLPQAAGPLLSHVGSRVASTEASCHQKDTRSLLCYFGRYLRQR